MLAKKKLFTYFLIISVALSLYLVMHSLEEKVFSWAGKNLDFFNFINLIIAWKSVKMFLLGLAEGVVAILICFVVSRVLSYELRLEAFFGRKIFVVNEKPRVSLVNLLKHSYLLFAPIIILTKIFRRLVSEDILVLYLLIGEFVAGYMWLIFLILTLPYIIIDYSRVRAFNEKSVVLESPSLAMNLFAILILGGGSILSAIPIYYDILDIFKDTRLATILFIYSIALFYVPALTFIVSIYLIFFAIGENEIRVVIESFEKLIEEKYGVIKFTKE